jgi:hypothetical protein
VRQRLWKQETGQDALPLWENIGAGKAAGDGGVKLGSSRETWVPAAGEKQRGKIGAGTKRKSDRARRNQQRKLAKKTENKQLKLT